MSTDHDRTACLLASVYTLLEAAEASPAPTAVIDACLAAEALTEVQRGQ